MNRKNLKNSELEIQIFLYIMKNSQTKYNPADGGEESPNIEKREVAHGYWTASRPNESATETKTTPEFSGGKMQREDTRSSPGYFSSPRRTTGEW